MAKKKVEEKINLDAILFKCRDILRKARNSGSFFEKRDMMLTRVFLRFIGEKFEDGVEHLRQDLTLMTKQLKPRFWMTPLLRTVHITCLWMRAGQRSSRRLHLS